jgi:hypothetical protein
MTPLAATMHTAHPSWRTMKPMHRLRNKAAAPVVKWALPMEMTAACPTRLRKDPTYVAVQDPSQRPWMDWMRHKHPAAARAWPLHAATSPASTDLPFAHVWALIMLPLTLLVSELPQRCSLLHVSLTFPTSRFGPMLFNHELRPRRRQTMLNPRSKNSPGILRETGGS